MKEFVQPSVLRVFLQFMKLVVPRRRLPGVVADAWAETACRFGRGCAWGSKWNLCSALAHAGAKAARGPAQLTWRKSCFGFARLTITSSVALRLWCCCRCRGKEPLWVCSPSSRQARPALAAWASAASQSHPPEQLLPRRTPSLTYLPSDRPYQLSLLATAAPLSNIECFLNGLLKAQLSQQLHSLLAE